MTKYKGPIEEVKLVEKVTLTKEQSTALEKMRNCHHLKNDKEALLVKHATGWMNAYRELNEIPMLAFAQLVLNDFSYEIDKSYKRGDKVLFQVGDSIPQVATLQERHPKYDDEWCTDEAIGYIEERYFRYATPEEKFWIGELRREEIGDCRDGDILVDDRGIHFTVGNEVDKESAGYWMKDENIVGIYPAESFKQYPKEQSNEQ